MVDVSKVFNVEVSPMVNDRMFDHFEFLAQVNISAAEKLLDGIIKDIQSLEHMPYRNPVYDRPYLPSGKYRYMISCARYRIVYTIEGMNVFVDDIQDCRQADNKSLLFQC